MKKQYHEAVDNAGDKIDLFFHRAFPQLHVKMPAFDFEQLADSMVMVVSTHRSQTDYFLLGWMLYKNGLPYVRIAAGDNLTTLPILGKKFTSFGAFSVKRDTGFKRNYVRDLCNQVVSMMEDLEPILLFPEGGRSYLGNMMEIKGGILLSAILAQARNPGKKVYLIPASISYEQLPELPYFAMLEKGKHLRKKGSNFFKRLLGNTFYFGADIIAFAKLLLKARFNISSGEVFVDIDTPVLVNDIVNVAQQFDASARDEVSGHRKSMHGLGDFVHSRFVTLYRILPGHITAGALKKLQANAKTTGKSDAIKAMDAILASCKERSLNMQSLAGMTNEQILALGIRQLRHVKALSVHNDSIRIHKQSIIDYYAAALSTEE